MVFWLQKKGLGLGWFVSPVSCFAGLFARPRAVLVIGSKSGQEEKKVCRVHVYACALLAETTCRMFFTFTPFLHVLWQAPCNSSRLRLFPRFPL